MEISENNWNKLLSIAIENNTMLKKMTVEAENELLTPSEVCKWLKISRNTYQNYVKNKVLNQIKIAGAKNGRVYVRRSEIERLTSEGKI